MKPISLTLEGVKSFLERITIDFEVLSAAGLFGIFGDTGSGKSTIVDGIIFSLYGAVNKGLVINDIINSRCDSACFEFVFDAETEDGIRRFLVYRKVTKSTSKGKAATSKAELFDITDSKIAIESNTSKVSAYIERLIGLSQNDFCTCVVLEQGKYAEFLNASPKDRKDIIGSIFSLQKYGPILAEKLREREIASNSELMLNKDRLASLGDISKEMCEEQAKKLETLQGQAKESRLMSEALEKTVAELKESEAKFKKSEQLKSEITALQDNINAAITECGGKQKKELEGLKQSFVEKIALLKANLDIEERLAKNETELLSARQILETNFTEIENLNKFIISYTETLNNSQESIERALEGLKLSTGFDAHSQSKGIKDLPRVLETYALTFENNVKEYKRLVSEKNLNDTALLEMLEIRSGLAKVQTDALSSRMEKVQEIKRLKENLLIQEEQYSIAVRDDAVGVIASTLSKGDVCPVCKNIVASVPEVSANLNDITQIIERIKFELTQAEKAYAVAETFLAGNAEKINSFDVKVAEAEKAQERLDALIVSTHLQPDCEELSSRIKDLSEKVGRRVSAFDQCNEQIIKAKSDLSNASLKLESAKKDIQRLTQTIQADKEVVAKVCPQGDIKQTLKKCEGELDVINNSLEKLSRLDVWQAELIVKQKEYEEIKNHGFDQEKAQKTFQALKESRELELVLSGDVKALSQSLELLNKQLSASQELKKQQIKLEEERNLIQRLKALTKGNNLMEFVAEEYIEAFTVTASERLFELTVGEYELSYDDGFYVIDHYNGGERRKVATVSGGETFLVSLALALAVSRAIEDAAKTKSVGFLFIDEGFGTLSPNFLDTAIIALERLRSPDFSVGLISHVPELRQRLPIKLFVTKSGNASVIKLT